MRVVGEGVHITHGHSLDVLVGEQVAGGFDIPRLQRVDLVAFSADPSLDGDQARLRFTDGSGTGPEVTDTAFMVAAFC